MVVFLLSWVWAQDPEPLERWVPTEDAIASIRSQASWCTDKTDLLPWETDWCAATPPECKGFIEACQAPSEQGCNQDGPEIELPDLHLEGLADIVQSLAIAIAVTIILSAIVAYYRTLPPEEPVPEVPLAPEAPKAILPTDIQPGPDPLQEARAALAAGQLGLALMLLRAASLNHLAALGKLVLHPSHTDREYVRLLDQQPEAAELKVIVRAIERFRYAGKSLDPQTIEAVLAAASRLVAPLLLLGLLGGAQMAYGRAGDHELLVPLLQKVGFQAELSGEISADLEGDPVYLWAIQNRDIEQTLPRLLHQVENGRRAIIILPSAIDGLPPEIKLNELPKSQIIPEESTQALVLIENIVEIQGDSTSFAKDADGHVVAGMVPVGDGLLILLGTPGLVDDMALLHAANVEFLRRVLDRVAFQGDMIYVINPTTPQDSPLSALFRAGLAPAAAQILLIFAAAAWWRGRRFATPLAPVVQRRRDFSEHLRAVASLYRASKASRIVTGAYAAWTLQRLRQRTRADDMALVRAVAQRTGMPPERVLRVLTQGRAAMVASSGDQAAESVDADLMTQEELWEIQQAMKEQKLKPSQSASTPWKRKSAGSFTDKAPPSGGS